MSTFRIIALLAMAVFFTSCHRSPLSCRSEYLYPTDLSSERINTPDPWRKCYYGQQIVVRWKLPWPPNQERPFQILLHLRNGNRTLETSSHVIQTTHGFWVYRLINQDFWCRGGILSYQVELLYDGIVVDTWTHSLWTDLIEINSEDYYP